jgi:hypothetical protein
MNPGTVADVIDIGPLARLLNRQKSGQYTAQSVMGFAMVAAIVWLGARAAVALLILLVLLSVATLRGHRWAGLALFGLSLSMVALAVAALCYDVFIRHWPPSPPGISTHRLRETERSLFFGVSIAGLVAAWYLIRAIHASFARHRLLPPPRADVAGRMQTWGRGLRRSATRWQSWAFVAFVAVGAALIVPQPPPVAVLLEAAGLPDWLTLLLMVVCLMGWVGVVVGGFARVRRHLAESSVEAQRRDTRPPVLLLRSFADDAVTVFPSEGLFLTRTGNTLEHVLEEKLRAYGPVIAIGRPGENLPPLGAAREYLAGETWRQRIGELIGQARLVVVVMGASEGLVFEYDQLATHGAIDKIVLVILPDGVGPLQERWERFVRHALGGRTIAPPPLQEALVALFPDRQRPTYVVHPKRRAEADHYSLALEAALHRRS